MIIECEICGQPFDVDKYCTTCDSTASQNTKLLCKILEKVEQIEYEIRREYDRR